MTAFYFGCAREKQSGHHMHRCVDGRLVSLHAGSTGLPEALAPFAIDGRFTPENERKQGAARMTWAHGYTVLAWHDYTGDERPGSNSVFLVPGSHTFVEMRQLLAKSAPEVAARQSVPLYLTSTVAL